MSGLILVRDAQGTPLMPMSAAYARRLLQSGKAQWVPHHAFAVIQLTQVIQQPVLRPILVGIRQHLYTAELFVLAEGEREAFPLLRIVVDLRTDIPWRMRRRAAHRRRRKLRQRHRAPRRQGQPFKLRRPNIMRSSWGAKLRERGQKHRMGPAHIPATIRWRSEAIARVITTLRALMPISHAVFLIPLQMSVPFSPSDREELRQHLIDAYGVTIADKRIAACAYCGTTEGRIVIDHIVPRSRGGTDAWNNLVLACIPCNERKGDRTPSEAGMSFLANATLPGAPVPPNRAGPYRQWTARLLALELSASGLAILWFSRQQLDPSNKLSELIAVLPDMATEQTQPAMTVIAKPVARLVKQVFSSHNYPLRTPLQPGWVHVRRAVKRRKRINRGLTIIDRDGHRSVRVVRADEVDYDSEDVMITIGMLCEGLRAGRSIIGIVTAIESSGRLRLLVPKAVERNNVIWQRVLISPRKHLRVLSTDRIIFLPVPFAEPEAAV
jgi:hypothetical protein